MRSLFRVHHNSYYLRRRRRPCGLVSFENNPSGLMRINKTTKCLCVYRTIRHFCTVFMCAGRRQIFRRDVPRWLYVHGESKKNRTSVHYIASYLEFSYGRFVKNSWTREISSIYYNLFYGVSRYRRVVRHYHNTSACAACTENFVQTILYT